MKTSKFDGVRYLSLTETARSLGISESTLRRRVHDGHILAYRGKGCSGLRFKVEDLENFMVPVDSSGFAHELKPVDNSVKKTF